MLVFINPRSGKRDAEKIYKKQVLPVFRMCGIETKEYGEGDYNVLFNERNKRAIYFRNQAPRPQTGKCDDLYLRIYLAQMFKINCWFIKK